MGVADGRQLRTREGSAAKARNIFEVGVGVGKQHVGVVEEVIDRILIVGGAVEVDANSELVVAQSLILGSCYVTGAPRVGRGYKLESAHGGGRPRRFGNNTARKDTHSRAGTVGSRIGFAGGYRVAKAGSKCLGHVARLVVSLHHPGQASRTAEVAASLVIAGYVHHPNRYPLGLPLPLIVAEEEHASPS